MNKIKPWIKSSGGKRIFKSDIHKLFPKKFNIYYEPFLGSGIMLSRVYDKCNKMIGSDINQKIISQWKCLKYNPSEMFKFYENEDLFIKWYNFVTSYNIDFHTANYTWILNEVTKDDFVFLDPPFSNLNNKQEESLVKEELEDFLSKLKCKWILTSNDEGTFEISPYLYKKQGLLDTYKMFKCFIND